MLGIIEGIINGFFKLINGAIGLINKIPGVNIKKIKLVEFQRLAKGGVVEEATPAIFGEDGAEAVVPLEKNTEWIQKIAKKLHTFTVDAKLSDQALDLDDRAFGYIERFKNEMGGIANMLSQIIGMLSGMQRSLLVTETGQDAILAYMPQVLEKMDNPVPTVFDTNTAASRLARPIDRELGKLSTKKERGR